MPNLLWSDNAIWAVIGGGGGGGGGKGLMIGNDFNGNYLLYF